MAIDPKLYEKYSGRSGDPYKRLGEALAQSSAHKSERAAQKDKTFSERYIEGSVRWRLFGVFGFMPAKYSLVVAGAIIVVIVILRLL